MRYPQMVKKDLSNFKNCKKAGNFFSYIFFKYIEKYGENSSEAPSQEIRLIFLKELIDEFQAKSNMEKTKILAQAGREAKKRRLAKSKNRFKKSKELKAKAKASSRVSIKQEEQEYGASSSFSTQHEKQKHGAPISLSIKQEEQEHGALSCFSIKQEHEALAGVSTQQKEQEPEAVSSFSIKQEEQENEALSCFSTQQEVQEHEALARSKNKKGQLPMSTKVMYFILRSDLSTELNWPLGAIFTQIAHAATACIWTFRNDKDVVDYMNEMDTMHKVTLKVENEEKLKAVAEKLSKKNIDHKIWIEDNMSVCIAIKPQSKEILKPLLKNLPLYK